jgi:hypothetical protein
MVKLERIARRQPPEEPTNMYDLIIVYVDGPSDNPSPEAKIDARPIEFQGGRAVKFSTVSPYTGGGFTFEDHQITEYNGNKFIACPYTGRGNTDLPPFDDPFQNPINEKKLSAAALDSDLTSVNSLKKKDSRTVAEKMGKTKKQTKWGTICHKQIKLSNVDQKLYERI